MWQLLQLDALLAELYARHFHNAGYAHALHPIRGQRIPSHTGICKPTNPCL
jgi:hypothetical protein